MLFDTIKTSIIFALLLFLFLNQKDTAPDLTTEFKTLKAECRNYQQKLSQKLNQNERELPFLFEEYRKRVIKETQVNVVYLISDEDQGSGFFVNAEGLILTNCHVVGTSEQIKVMTWSEQWCEAKVLGRDPVADIALVQLDQESMQLLREKKLLPEGAVLANSDAVEVGDFVFTIGAPHNKMKTVSGGQVSNTSRYLNGLPVLDEISGLYNLYIQVDAGIMPGHSGGPSVNLRGEVIGINTRANYQNGAEGYLLPINYAKERMSSLITSDSHKNYYNTLGFDLHPHIAQIDENRKHLPHNRSTALVIARVDKDSDAHRLGCRSGDLILAVNGKPVELNNKAEAVSLRREIALGEEGRICEFIIKHIKDGQIRQIQLATYSSNNKGSIPQQNRIVEFSPISTRR